MKTAVVECPNCKKQVKLIIDNRDLLMMIAKQLGYNVVILPNKIAKEIEKGDDKNV